MNNNFDILVIGAGHAGIEACISAAKMGLKVGLITMRLDNMGMPSCNPSIGGSAKGHLVKEIDALGGEMGFLADKAGLSFKMLNTSKGPAVWSPRCQIDKDLYPAYVAHTLRSTPNLTLIQGKAEEVLLDNDKVCGVILDGNEILNTKALILSAGTFLRGIMHTGEEQTKGGRIGEQSSDKISDMLNDYGFERGRLKTGTPPRIHYDSINLNNLKVAETDENPVPFSYRTPQVRNVLACYQTNTNETTHSILREGFDRSPMFTGRIKGAGPRYCPSVEEKIFRFDERPSHKVLLEPEGLNTKSVYVNGFSTSLPIDIQLRGLHSIKGLENAKLLKQGYAVEYDFFFPYQLRFTLETKAIEGLYFAGQINGTSGYEEAASQGLVAGINAALKIKGEEPFIPKRSESYIGVMIDDLVNKNTEEPYRIFTSLAEYRLLLRQDNADERLMKYGHQFGLISDITYNQLQERITRFDKAMDFAKDIKPDKEVINNYLVEKNLEELKEKTTIYNLLKRSVFTSEFLFNLTPQDNFYFKEIMSDKDTLERLNFAIKYEGYIQRQLREINNFAENENKFIPDTLDYSKIPSLSREGIEKLTKIRPGSLGQASRIQGVSPADVSVLSLYLRSS